MEPEPPPSTSHPRIQGKSGPIGTVTGSSLVIRESMTMALYITISLLAVLAAQPPGDRSVTGVLGIIWGTTLALSVAHWLAFRLTARLFSIGTTR